MLHFSYVTKYSCLRIFILGSKMCFCEILFNFLQFSDEKKCIQVVTVSSVCMIIMPIVLIKAIIDMFLFSCTI